MKTAMLSPEVIDISPDLCRTSSAKVFEDHLRASIDEVGLAEPIKVAKSVGGRYLVIDGVLRLRAIQVLRASDPSRFVQIPVYVMDFSQRFEIRFQSDIYQDLLPSQLATLVEHLHLSEKIQKADIAKFIGVSSPTIRNYTGLWRMIQRGNLFARMVELMDLSVLPSSNPYAWLRLTDDGIRVAIETSLSDGELSEDWIERQINQVRSGESRRLSLKDVELATGSLDPNFYREGQDIRKMKRDLGLRRAVGAPSPHLSKNSNAFKNLDRVRRSSKDPVLRNTAQSLQKYLG
jgi:hypothetical protein